MVEGVAGNTALERSTVVWAVDGANSAELRMEEEAIFYRNGKFTTHSKMVYAVFIRGG